MARVQSSDSDDPAYPYGRPEPGQDINDQDPTTRFWWLMEQVDNLVAHRDYYQAIGVLKHASALAESGVQKRSVTAAALNLNAVGLESFREYEQAYRDGDYLKAIKGLGLVRRTYDPLPSAVAAARLLSRIESDPQVQAALQEVKAQEIDDAIARLINCPVCLAAAPEAATQPAARSLRYADASRVEHVRKLPADRQFRVVALLENMVKLYPNAPGTAGAAEDLKAIRNDKELWAALQRYATEQQAQGLYNAAEMYRRNGMNAKAVEYYERLAEKYPDTPLAAKAREMIARLQP